MLLLTQCTLVAVAALLSPACAQSAYPTSTATCSASLTARYATPSVAPGFSAVLIAQNLTRPRDLVWDDKGGRLLVVESGVGVVSYGITGDTDCLRASNRTVVVDDETLNHGIQLADNGANSSWLYASNSDSIYRWAYDHASASNLSNPEILVNNMAGADHTTRTLLLSKKVPGYIIVGRGSVSNLDYEASSLDSGHSQVKAFRIDGNASYPQDFLSSGVLLGWGLRNEVGIDEHPGTGRIYGVENSADQITRDGVDIHQNNPGEELNYLGNLENATAASPSSRNFGYPECFAAWNTSVIPNFNGTVGQQFTIGTTNATNNDTICANRIAPRLTFQAHMAPLGLLFNPNGTVAWVTFHGSWNRDEPAGYKLSMIDFDARTGEPVKPSTSTDALIDIMTNSNETACPRGCFRPVGLTWDSRGRLFMTSDSTGEIYAIIRSGANGNTTANTNATGTTGLPSTTASGASSASASATGGGLTSTVSTSVSTGVFAVLCTAFAFLV